MHRVHCSQSVTGVNCKKVGGVQMSISSSAVSDTALPDPAFRLNTSIIPSAWSSWSTYDNPEQLDALFNSLLNGGIRESRLKQKLLADGLLEGIKRRAIKGAVVVKHEDTEEITGTGDSSALKQESTAQKRLVF